MTERPEPYAARLSRFRYHLDGCTELLCASGATVDELIKLHEGEADYWRRLRDTAARVGRIVDAMFAAMGAHTSQTQPSGPGCEEAPAAAPRGGSVANVEPGANGSVSRGVTNPHGAREQLVAGQTVAQAIGSLQVHALSPWWASVVKLPANTAELAAKREHAALLVRLDEIRDLYPSERPAGEPERTEARLAEIEREWPGISE